MEDVNFLNSDTNPTVSSNNETFDIEFYKSKYFFLNLQNFVGFIKKTENTIRHSTEYNNL